MNFVCVPALITMSDIQVNRATASWFPMQGIQAAVQGICRNLKIVFEATNYCIRFRSNHPKRAPVEPPIAGRNEQSSSGEILMARRTFMGIGIKMN